MGCSTGLTLPPMSAGSLYVTFGRSPIASVSQSAIQTLGREFRRAAMFDLWESDF